jgi:hypothetical protein
MHFRQIIIQTIRKTLTADEKKLILRCGENRASNPLQRSDMRADRGEVRPGLLRSSGLRF